MIYFRHDLQLYFYRNLSFKYKMYVYNIILNNCRIINKSRHIKEKCQRYPV